jgi:hypothetical protein
MENLFSEIHSVINLGITLILQLSGLFLYLLRIYFYSYIDWITGDVNVGFCVVLVSKLKRY